MAGNEDAGARKVGVRCKSARASRRTSAAAFGGPAPEADDGLLLFAPYAHAAPRRNSITPARQRAFISALAETGVVTAAARRIGASLEALYKLRNRPGAEAFAAAWEMALDRGLERSGPVSSRWMYRHRVRPPAGKARCAAGAGCPCKRRNAVQRAA